MPSSKAMLATALAKANTAVQLDNTHSYTFARKYYTGEFLEISRGETPHSIRVIC
ncbi:hypothetical protein M426DRAFT_321672 [Hypoxylon sp. CI-4A]|nr:hypothetical protein M426DRAFT_321672 [Hypoxylon sp. CI-4A]